MKRYQAEGQNITVRGWGLEQGRGATGQWYGGRAGAAKFPFQKIYYQELLIHINIQMEVSCFWFAVTIIEQFLLL